MPETNPSTIQRDLAFSCEQLKAAKATARRDGAKETWFQLDVMEARLQGLMLYVGLSHP